MKLISQFLFIFAFTSFLGLASSDAATLKENMKEAGLSLRTIKNTLNDPAKASSNAAECEKMFRLFSVMRNQIPTSISEMPSKDQPAAIKDYQMLIDQVLVTLELLKMNFQSGDLRSARDNFRVLLEIQDEGHEKYEF